MEVLEAPEAEWERGDAGRFSGEVWINQGLKAADQTGVVVVSFSPGSRTHWHSHPGGQFLIGVSGFGLVRSRDSGEAHRLAPGDIVYVAPGEVHFHGASPASPMTHVAVNGGGAPDWREPVADADYGG